jgi:hypothetical protein
MEESFAVGGMPTEASILGAPHRGCVAFSGAETVVYAGFGALVATGWCVCYIGTKVTKRYLMSDDDFAEAFELGNIAPADFDHAAHLRAAFCLVRRDPFLEACIAMRNGLQDLARRAGRPGLYHETITLAFMSIVAQRVAGQPVLGWDGFLAAHPDLADRALLGRWYRRETLESAQARARFVMPDVQAP